MRVSTIFIPTLLMQSRPHSRLTKLRLIFSTVDNGKHMHSQEQRKKNVVSLKLPHLAHRALVIQLTVAQWFHFFKVDAFAII